MGNGSKKINGNPGKKKTGSGSSGSQIKSGSVSYTVPKDIKGIVGKSENFYLAMHRFLILEMDNENGKPGKNNLKPGFYKDSGRSDNITKVIREAVKSSKLNGKLKESTDAMEESGIYDICNMTLRQVWNMNVGLGTSSVSDVSMTLHHIHGVPYIPGQSIKGVVRSFIIREYFDNNENAAMCSNLFADIFGRSEVVKNGKKLEACKGKVIFFDAVTDDQGIECVTDIMNSHHTNYYDGGELNDTESPVPVKMMAIRNAKFVFRIAAKKKDNIFKPGERPESTEFGEFEKACAENRILAENNELKLTEVAGYYLKQALWYSGIGAKTAVGYGYFKAEEKNDGQKQ